MKTLIIDKDACIGCGLCVEACPQVFELKEDDKAYVIHPEKCDACNCQEAIDVCPVTAIAWKE